MNTSGSTFSCSARYTTAAVGTSDADRGNRASISKNFNNTAKPRRVAPVLLPTSDQSSPTSVHDATSSSSDHSICMAPDHRRPL